MERITEEQYLAALEIVRKYKAQIDSEIEDAKSGGKIQLTHWAEKALKDGLISVRLRNVLRALNVEYLEDVTPECILKSRIGGKKSIDEFSELKKRKFLPNPTPVS